MNLILISFSCFLAIMLSITGIYSLATREKRNVSNRMQKFTEKKIGDRGEGDQDKESGLSFRKIMHRAGSLMVKKGMTKQMEEELARADIPLRVEEYLAIWALAALVPGSLLYISTGNLVLTALGYFLGILIPPMLVGSARKKRLKKFSNQLNDSLAIMSNALRAGFSLLQAMELVSKEMPNPISKEFARTFREINYGTSTEEALQNLVKRVNSDDMDLLVTAVLIQRQVGGNLAEILDNISHTIRERIRIQGEIRTLTAQGKISGLIIGLIPPILVVILLIMNPDYVKPLFSTQVGLLLLAAGIIGEIIGIILIKRIITIDI